VGFDLGGTKMLAAAFNENFEILAHGKKKNKIRRRSRGRA
jgi:predicted NBD/HSP70 family sugar kinase